MILHEELTPYSLKDINRQSIYRFIRDNGTVSRQGLLIHLGLSLPTITRNLKDLQREGLIDAAERITGTGGRNAVAYSLAANARFAVGVFLSANHMNAALVNLKGETLALVRKRVRFAPDSDSYLRMLGEMVTGIVAENRMDEEKLLGVTISVAGLVADDGESVTYGKTLGFTGKTREQFAKYIPYPCTLAHDSYTAAIAEMEQRKDLHTAFYFFISNSIGGAFIMNGRVVFGDTGKGAEIGHMTVINTAKAKTCYCGKKGCFETVCRATELDAYTDGNLERFFALLSEGDREARKRFDNYLNYMALGINNVRMLFDCPIILGGYVGAHIGPYMDELHRRVDERNPFNDPSENYLYPCIVKTEAVAIGAALTRIEAFVKEV